MKNPHVVIAAGGTGGHMFPAQSLAEAMAADGWQITLTTDQRGVRYAEHFAEDIPRIVLPTGSFSQGSMLKRILAPFRILQGIVQAWSLFSKHRPNAVVGFGGYPSFPALAVARLRGIPYIIHEQNAVLGRVNKFFHKRAVAVACGLWPVLHSGSNAVFIGNPVRASALKYEATPLPEGDKKQILVFGGSQGASFLSKIVPEAISRLTDQTRQGLCVVQQAREGEIDEVRAAYTAMGVQFEIAPFFPDLPAKMAASDFVIARSGASTLAELQVIGRGSILVPLPTAANDHQRMNARALVAAGAAYEYDQDENQAQDMADWLNETLNVRDRLARMADAAYRLARPDAARRMADLVERQLK